MQREVPEANLEFAWVYPLKPFPLPDLSQQLWVTKFLIQHMAKCPQMLEGVQNAIRLTSTLKSSHGNNYSFAHELANPSFSKDY